MTKPRLSWAIQRYARQAVVVPNGREVTGYKPGLAAATLTEHILRDRLAEQIGGVTEANLGYGRADVLTAELAIEVEPCGNWRHAVRQALGYAAQTGCRPAVALFGAMRRDEVLKIYLQLRDGHPPVELWWCQYGHWRRISSRHHCKQQHNPR